MKRCAYHMYHFVHNCLCSLGADSYSGVIELIQDDPVRLCHWRIVVRHQVALSLMDARRLLTGEIIRLTPTIPGKIAEFQLVNPR